MMIGNWKGKNKYEKDRPNIRLDWSYSKHAISCLA